MLKKDPEVFIVDLDVKKYTEPELGMIDTDLRLLNADIYDCVKYIQEGMEQKAKDLIHHTDPILNDLSKNQHPELEKIADEADDIRIKVSSRILPVDQKFKQAIDRVRNLETINTGIRISQPASSILKNI